VLKNRQLKSVEALYAAFDQAQVDYLPLKGCIMKPMYPKAELRAMNDADILIKVDQYDKIKPVLEQLSYQFVAESDCELKWICKGLYLELHKRLIPSFIKDFYAYFGDGWQLAVPESGNRHVMSKEDEFLYIFTHFARHYREGGVGIRHMADIWYYRKKTPELQEDKITAVLEKMSLHTFYQNILATLDNWFEGGEETDITRKITKYVVESGNYGTEETKIVAAAVRAGDKKKNIVQMVFPSLNNMRYSYPVLKKCPALLPGVWVYRWGKVLFFRRDKIKMQQDRLKLMEDDKMKAFEASMREVGINMDFEEH